MQNQPKNLVHRGLAASHNLLCFTPDHLLVLDSAGDLVGSQLKKERIQIQD